MNRRCYYCEVIGRGHRYMRASQVVPVLKDLPANIGDINNVGLIPGSGGFSGGGYGNALSILA